ncbi:MAG: hypothetical protein ACM3N4_01750, partial [Nitrososphaerota archaeon]
SSGLKGRMQWFRLHSEARTDAKLESLPDDEFRVWFRLLCFAAEQDGDGRGSIVGYDDELLAIELCDGDTALLRRTIEHLKKLRILSEDEDGITFRAFEKRQYDKPSNRPERVRARVAAFRERQRQDSNAEVTPGNASVLPGNAAHLPLRLPHHHQLHRHQHRLPQRPSSSHSTNRPPAHLKDHAILPGRRGYCHWL